MLLRISLIVAILGGLGVIGVTQFKVRPHIQGIIDARNDFEGTWKKETDRANKLKRSLDGTNAILVTTIKKLAETEAARDAAEAKAQSEQTRANGLQENLNKRTAELRETQQKLAQWELVGLTPDQIKALVDSEKKLRAAVSALTSENELLAKRNNALKTRIDELVGPNIEPLLDPGTKGKVLVVDPKWDFVVLDIGEQANLRANGVLMVHRNGKLVAKVRIVSIQGPRSIANVIPGWKLDEVMEGDSVFY
jgi:cell division protein FtsB